MVVCCLLSDANGSLSPSIPRRCSRGTPMQCKRSRPGCLKAAERDAATVRCSRNLGIGQRQLRCRFLGRHARRLNDARHCLASEKRASGKSRCWNWADQLALWGFEAVDCLGSCSAGWADCARYRQLRHRNIVSFEGHAPRLAGLDNLTTTSIRAAGMPDWPQAVSRAAAIGLPVLGVHVMRRPSLILAGPWGVVLARWFRR